MTRPGKPQQIPLTLPRQLLLLFAFCVAGAAAADDYTDARARLIEAYEASDTAAMITAAEAALEARPDYPAGLFNLALSYVLDGKLSKALDVAERLGELCLDAGLDAHPALEPLRESPRWQAIRNQIESMRKPLGTARVAFRLADGPFIPEGIAVDGDTLYLGSIRSGDIVRHDGESHSLLPDGPAGSIFGMRLADDALWFAAAATDQYAGASDAQGTGLFRLPLSGGSELDQWPLPDEGAVLGDFIFAGDAIIASDQQGGRLYRFTPDRGFELLLAAGPLRSPQGLALDETGQAVYVADWNRGLFLVSLDGDTVAKVTADASLYGIDGLYRHRDWLIAVQNGIRPHRVSAHRLSGDGLSVTESRILLMNHPDFDEPTLGTIANNAFYVVANSHWNRFGEDGELPDGLSGPVVLRLELP